MTTENRPHDQYFITGPAAELERILPLVAAGAGIIVHQVTDRGLEPGLPALVSQRPAVQTEITGLNPGADMQEEAGQAALLDERGRITAELVKPEPIPVLKADFVAFSLQRAAANGSSSTYAKKIASRAWSPLVTRRMPLAVIPDDIYPLPLAVPEGPSYVDKAAAEQVNLHDLKRYIDAVHAHVEGCSGVAFVNRVSEALPAQTGPDVFAFWRDYVAQHYPADTDPHGQNKR